VNPDARWIEHDALEYLERKWPKVSAADVVGLFMRKAWADGYREGWLRRDLLVEKQDSVTDGTQP
jgi:hypothetical protein